MPLAPRRNMLFAVLLTSLSLLLPVLGGDVWGAVAVRKTGSAPDWP